MPWCSECDDQFEPVEYVTVDFEGPNFCSTECEERWTDREENTAIYEENCILDRSAPVFA